MVINSDNNYEGLDKWLEGKKKVFLVCDDSLKYLTGFNKKLDALTTPVVHFSDFQPNPLYDSVVEGVKLFREEQCDSIIAVGGGSAIDVAKCVKLYINLEGDGSNGSWLKAEVIPNDIPFLAMPTTAGTGSEATRYAVIYYEGAKQSITSESFIPDTVLMDPSVLKTLPLYQKKATMCDALCHAIESYWSVNSTDESKEYSKEAIQYVLNNMDGYLNNTDEGNAGMLHAAHMAGKAINITQTTAGHAMCYKVTSLFGCAHGHAAMLCDRVLFPWMVENTDKCIDNRGEEYLKQTLDELGRLMGGEDAKSGARKFQELFDMLAFEVPMATDEQFDELKTSVNPVRLKNHPIGMDEKTIDSLYHEIFVSYLTYEDIIDMILSFYTFTLGYWKAEIERYPYVSLFLNTNGLIKMSDEYEGLITLTKTGDIFFHKYIKEISERFINYARKKSFEIKHSEASQWFVNEFKLDDKELGDEIADYICGNLYHYGYKVSNYRSRRKGEYYSLIPIE